ncbi:PD-(D/E)XK nuclease family protein [Magnetofaba australis]|nr:PD-(D/E)XK nuclease family protein [Magnetofaba australis]
MNAYQALLQSVGDTQTLVVTVNRRLARHLHERYAQMRQIQGDSVWETPRILPQNAWLETLWRELEERDGIQAQAVGLPLLLNASRESLAWEGVIAAHQSRYPLLKPAVAARGVMRAWGLLRQWRRSLDDLTGYDEPDVLAFRFWAAEFDALCAERGWLPSAALADELAGRITPPMLPKRLILAGFDQLTPQMQGFYFETLTALGVVVETWRADALADAQARCIPCSGLEAELRAALQWTRRTLLDNPAARIGIAAPNLPAIAEPLRRLSWEILRPHSRYEGVDPADAPLNISAGRPLSDYPAAHDALLGLRLCFGDASIARVGAFLRSPFLPGGLREAERRALLDARLRRLGRRAMRPDGLLRALSDGAGFAPASCPQLHERFGAALQAEEMGGLRQTRRPSAWAGVFSRTLARLGWPGDDRSLDSAEHQTVTAWGQCLSAMGALDDVSGAVDLHTALSQLTRLANERDFQPDGGLAQAQAMGLLEAAGEQFDALWIVGMIDEAWPPPPDPNPYLPLTLQRQWEMPRASAARERDYAEVITQRLLTCAPQVVVSWSVSEEDRPLRVSPLVAHLALEDADADADAPDVERYLGAPLESFEDMQAPAFDAQLNAPGGAGLFQSQSQCPFQAFARYRLRAESLEEPGSGPDARRRGQFAHRALDRFWRVTRDSAGLAALNDVALLERIVVCVGEVLAESLESGEDAAWWEAVTDLERGRLIHLLRNWLDGERQRMEPFTVTGLELPLTLQVGPLNVRARLDRVDRLDGDEALVIDYKTGLSSPAGWFGPRPADPQLPLYAAFAHELGPICGAAFGQLRPGNERFQAILTHSDAIPGGKALEQTQYSERAESWQAQLQAWRDVLIRLADAFASGAAAVDPIKPSACLYCGLQTLCRVDQLRGADAASAEQEDGDGV